MATFDVRKDNEVKISNIIFADEKGGAEEYCQGYCITQSTDFKSGIQINDEDDAFVLVSTKEHARNLIKALEKAIELGWLK